MLIVAGVMFQMQRIERDATSPAHRDAWETKLGEAAGYLFAFGQAAVWGILWVRHRRKVA